MYSTCIYCNRDLGSNSVVETLLVGRRIAFDEAKGRLWIVCRKCEKWNLVPFDTRLESIDTCARLFSQSHARFSTDNIGIARVKEGLELIRIGAAERPEFAAWRYGNKLVRRRTVHGFRIGIAAATVGALVVAVEMSPLAGIFNDLAVDFSFSGEFSEGFSFFRNRRPLVALTAPDGGESIRLTRRQLADCWIVQSKDDSSAPGSFTVDVPARANSKGLSTTVQDRLRFAGPTATEALGKIMPHLNRAGGSTSVVNDAVQLLQNGSPIKHMLFGKVNDMDKATRLAIEMFAHEETEREALTGDLRLLERQWHEAERVAGISDNLARTGNDDGGSTNGLGVRTS